MSDVLIIGLGTTAQVGKDTAAAYLEENYPGEFKNLSFAYKLKKVVQILFDLSDEQMNGPVEVKEAVDPRYGISPREIMQGVGQKMREIYSPIWVEAVLNVAIPAFIEQGYTKFTISDVRYPNEADAIHEKGGTVTKINRKKGGVSVGKNHSSETAMVDYQDYDFIIDNNGTLEEFFAKIEDMVEEVTYGRAKGEDNN